MFPFELMRLSGVACYDRILYQEIDYLNEGRNADRFRSDFRKQKWVKVPVSISWSLFKSLILISFIRNRGDLSYMQESTFPSLKFNIALMRDVRQCQIQY